MNANRGDLDISTLAQLRADIPLHASDHKGRPYIYLNTCTFGPVLRSIQRRMAAALRAENEEIIAIRAKEPGVRFYGRVEKARHTVAEMLGVPADDVAWLYNTTTASRLAIMSFDWQPGDKLAVTDVEHLSTHSVAQGLAQGRGVEVTVIPSAEANRQARAGAFDSEDGPGYTPSFFLERLDRLLTPDHRLLVMSHVSNIDGRRLPVAEATRLARARGVRTLIDGAQSLGMFPVNVQEIGAEFYSGSVHKWLMGPPGIGFLVISREARQNYNPHHAPIPTDASGKPCYSQVTAATLNELGTSNAALRIGAGACVEIMQRVGLETIEKHVRALTAQLRAGLRAVPGIRVASPDAWEISSSITTIQLHEGSPARCQRLVERLLDDYRIVVKVRPEICGVRMGIAAFNTAAEIEQVLTAVAQLAPAI